MPIRGIKGEGNNSGKTDRPRILKNILKGYDYKSR